MTAIRKYRIAIIAVAIGIGAVGCSGESTVQPDTGSKAQLDYSTGTIRMPVDEYRLSPADQERIELARQTVLTKCLRASGFAEVNVLKPTLQEDRPYGLWDAKRASKYGYAIPNDEPESQETPSESLQDPQASSGPNPIDEARVKCVTSEQGILSKFTPAEETLQPTVSARLRDEAYSQASADPSWAQAREKWWACLAETGLTPRKQDGAWSSEQANDILSQQDPVNPSAKDKQEEIRVALLEAKCNDKVKLTQTLGDIEASYQTPLIKKQVAALNEEKTANQAFVSAANTYLSANQ